MSEWVRLTDELKSCPPMYRYHYGFHDIGYQSAISDTPEHFGWVRLTNEEAITLACLLGIRGWIDVNDRVPTPSEIYDERRYPVVVENQQGNRFVSTARIFFYSSDDGYAWFPDKISSSESARGLTVTHWQSLPAPPREEN